MESKRKRGLRWGQLYLVLYYIYFNTINVMVVQHDRLGIKWYMFHMYKRLFKPFNAPAFLKCEPFWWLLDGRGRQQFSGLELEIYFSI